MASLNQEFGIRRVYEAESRNASGVALELSDREVDLGSKEYALYQKLAEEVPGIRSEKRISADLGMSEPQLRRLLDAFASAGLFYRADTIPKTLTGVEFHTLFNKVLPSWLDEAFSHPFWDG